MAITELPVRSLRARIASLMSAIVDMVVGLGGKARWLVFYEKITGGNVFLLGA